MTDRHTANRPSQKRKRKGTKKLKKKHEKTKRTEQKYKFVLAAGQNF